MKNLKLRTKLLLGFGITVLILLFIGIRQYMVLNELEDKRNDLTKSNEWADAIMEAKYAVKSDMQLLMEVLQTNSEQELNAYWSEHLGFVESYDTDMKNLINLSADNSWGHEFAGTKAKIDKIAAELDEKHNTLLVPAFEEVKSIKKQLIENSDNASSERILAKLEELDNTLDNAGNEIIKSLETHEEEIMTVVENAIAASSSLSAKAINETILLCLAGLIFAIVITVIITRGITMQLGGEPGEVAEIAKKLSNGDLTFDMKKYGERIGVMNDILDMVYKLKEIVAGIRQGAENIAAASQQLSSGSQQLSQGATEQASSAEEISSSMEEMTSDRKSVV